MSSCFLIKSNDEIISPIKNCLANLFDQKARSKMGLQSHCYHIKENHIHTFSYGFSNMLIKAVSDKKEVYFYLSNLAIAILGYLLDEKIDFTFCFIQLADKEDEETVIKKIVDTKLSPYSLLSEQDIKQRQWYLPR